MRGEERYGGEGKQSDAGWQSEGSTTRLIAGQGYAYSRPILEAGAEEVFAQMDFNPERFSARYSPAVAGEGA